MGTLQSALSQQSIQLREHHIVGRHPDTAHTLIKDSAVSRSHCLIEWHSGTWYLQDISANGTFINNKRVAKNIKHPISQSDQIHFGDINGEAWQVTDLAKPSAFLKSTNANLDDIPLNTQVSVLNDEHGERLISRTLSGQWLVEQDGNILAIESGDTFKYQLNNYIFVTIDNVEATQECQQDIEHVIKVNFKVSQNEEHVGVTLDVSGQLIDLQDRTHHYLVLLLARKYQEDLQQNVPITEAGWVDKALLMKQTRMEETHINTQFYRFRKQLHTAGKKLGLDLDIIERRRGEIRVNCSSITIRDTKAA